MFADAPRVGNIPTPGHGMTGLVFSFEPRFHGFCGSQKYSLISVANVKR
jgi:hypothetical protein